MDWNIWHDCLTDKECQLLATLNYERYGVLPDVKPRLQKRIQPIEEEPDKETVKVMEALPEDVKHNRGVFGVKE
jgi:hypothetical protein